MKDGTLSRREFLHRTSAGLAVAGVAGRGSAVSTQPFAAGDQAAKVGETYDLKSLRIWDGHTHLIDFAGSTPAERMADMLRFGDRMDIERMCVFLGMSEAFHGGREEMRRQNDEVLDAVSHSNGRAFGYAFMDPFSDVPACVDEINRCVRDGPMVGLKFEYDTIRHPNDQRHAPTYGTPRDLSVLDPILERAAELNAVIMHHTFFSTLGPQDIAESTPMEIAELARRHPTVTMICGHTGGNWEIGIRAIRDVKNVYADLCGSDPTEGYTEMAVRELGPKRVMYGSDAGGRSFASQLAKVMGADIPNSTRRLILGGNLRRVLQPILEAKGMKA
ncbi:MAG: amidohydrolase family protein [Terriglobia bacterium]